MRERSIRHIAIMMDGNGRWAQKRGEQRMVGHYYGEKKFEEMCEIIDKKGIDHFTVYAFSTENWKRPKEEVDAIMGLLGKYFEACINLADRCSYKVDVIGNKRNLSNELLSLINDVESKTKDNKGLNIHIAINYGGRDEIIRAVDSFVEVARRDASISCTEEMFKEYLDCKHMPDPDIVIRTGGEKRLSNFMLWELAYSELFFSNSYWPDFSEEELNKIIEDFSNRDRRFGAVGK